MKAILLQVCALAVALTFLQAEPFEPIPRKIPPLGIEIPDEIF